MVTSQEESCHYDRATIWIDQYYVTSIGLCSAQNVHAWLRSQIDLRDFAGQTVVFAIEVETDASLYSSVFVGDLSFESGVLIPTPGATATPTPTSIPATPVPTATSVPAGEEIRNPGFELGDNGDWESSPYLARPTSSRTMEHIREAGLPGWAARIMKWVTLSRASTYRRTDPT
jgi:hypothetical protein